MSENVFQKETAFTENFLLEEQPLYTPVTQESTIVVKPLANNVNVEEISAPAGNLTDLNFTYRPTSETFVNNGMILRMKLPLKITRKSEIENPGDTKAGGVITTRIPVDKDNYAQYFFGNYSNLALRQYGLLNLLDTFTLNLNGNQVSSVRNIREQALSVFPYYDESSVDEYFDASTADRFARYESYDGDEKGIKTVDAYETGSEFILSNPVGANDENIFRSSYRKGYNTRKPAIVFTSCDPTRTVFTGYTILETFLPFSLLGLSSSDSSLYGVTNMEINIKLKSNPISYLFSQKAVAGELMFDKLELDTHTTSTTYSSLFIRSYRAPDYITNEMKDRNGMVPPYRLLYSETSCLQNVTVKVPALGKTRTVLNTVNSEVVPKSLYILALRKMEGNYSNVPSVCARISDVTVRMGQISTLYTRSSGALYNVMKGNGLNFDKEHSLFTGGFPHQYNISTDIGAAGEAFVGEYKSSNFDIELSLTNLDTEERDYEIFVTLVYDSFVQYLDGKFMVQRALISGINLSTENFAKSIYSDRMRRVQMIGGSWLGDVWNKVKKGAKGAYNFYKDNKDTIDTVTKGVMTLLKGSGQLSNISGGAYNISGGAGINPSNVLGAGKGVKNALGGKSVGSIHFK